MHWNKWWLKEAIKLKYWRKVKAVMLFLQDNIAIHNVQVAVAEVANCSFELLPHPLIHQTQLHLTSFCFLNSNPTCMVTILETIMSSYLLWQSFWRTKIQPSVMSLQCFEHCRTKFIDIKVGYIEK